MSAMQKCSDCLYYDIKSGLCRRYPDYVRRGESSWCGEFKADSTGNTDDLRQLISDVNDAALYDRSQLEERIDALESRIEKLERRMDGKEDMDGEMLLAIGKRLCAVERKLNHKGVEQ